MKPPVGWFAVAYSHELGRRGVVPLHYFDEPLLMFRAADGQAVVLGAHHWCFDGIARSAKLSRAAVRSWPVCERNGMVFVHFHPSGGAPTWEIPPLVEYGAPDWTSYVTRRWTLDTDVHRMTESTVAAHRRPRRDADAAPSTDVAVDGADFRLRTRAEMQTPMGRVAGTLDIQAHGFGYTVVRFTGAVETLLITTATPVDGERVDARYTFSVKRLADDGMTRLIEQRFVEELQRQVESDERRRAITVSRALHGIDDAPARAWRGWAEQFYV